MIQLPFTQRRRDFLVNNGDYNANYIKIMPICHAKFHVTEICLANTSSYQGVECDPNSYLIIKCLLKALKKSIVTTMQYKLHI